MAIGNDFTINYGAKTVTHTSGTDVYTVLAFFQWLATTFAITAQMDDDFPFVSDTPQVYRWVNGWDMGDDVSYKFLKSGAVESSDALKLYSNLYTIGSQFRNSMIYIIQNDAEVTPWWNPGNIDVVVKVKAGGALIAGGTVTVFSRDTDCLYDHNDADLSAGGRNPVGVNTFEDGNYKLAGGVYTGDLYLDVDTIANFGEGNFACGGTSAASGRIQGIDTPNTRLYLCQVEGEFSLTEGVVERAIRGGANLDGTATNTAVVNVIASFNDISIAFGDISRDLNNGAGLKPYKVEIDCAGRTMLQVYQYLKYVCAHNSSLTINGDAGEEYRSALEPTYTESKQAPFGVFAGGVFFGARGVWVTNYAVASFQLIDANGDQQLPPNYQKVVISHASLLGCQILVSERSGVNIIKNQYTIDSASSAGSIFCTGTINANKCPQSGNLRVGDTRYSYASFSGTVFSGVSPDPSSETGDLYVPQFDGSAGTISVQSGNIILASAFDVKTRVRKYGFKDYSVDTSFPTTGLTVTPILASDPQAT